MSVRSRRRAMSVAVVSAVILAVGGATLPAFAEESGSITGHLTDAGLPVTDATVTLYDTSFGWHGGTSVDATGAFTFAGVPAGEYKIEFSTPRFTQWAAQKSFFFEADVITVLDGQTTLVEEVVRPHGTISGQVTYAPGVPAAGVQVTASMAGPPGGASFATTDANGYYKLDHLLVGDYRVQFRRAGSPTQYAHGQRSFGTADLISVTAGTTTTADEELLPVGQLTGVLTTAGGAPVPHATVIATSLTAPDAQIFGSTGSDGRYSITAFTGDYTLAFVTRLGTQWATGRSSAAQADPLTIVAEPITQHDETLAPTGTVTFTAVDSVTGQPVSDFCVSTSFASSCTETGTLSTELLPGSYNLFHYDGDGGDYLGGQATAVVSSGATTSVVLQLVPAATVTATITDRATGAPVEYACLELVDVTEPSGHGIESGWCTDASGTVTLTQRKPGTYKAFVWARDGVHGHQWVGYAGGVGEFQQARSITITAGQDLVLSGITLDPAGGAITGTVTDEITGAPVRFGTASLSSYNTGYGGQDGMYSFENGHYTVSGLGPYQWTLLFSGFGYAYEWSGDQPTRQLARSVQVSPSAAVTHDVELGLGTTVTGVITDADGTLAAGGRVLVYNASTRDEIGIDDIFDTQVTGRYTAQVMGVQRVKIFYFAQIGGVSYQGWAGGDDFASADTFTIRPHGSQTIDITATQLG